jgi:hypothetical protein
MRLLALLLVLLPAGGTAIAQRSDVVLTKNEVRRMAPEAVTRRLFGGLAPLILPIADRGRRGVRPTRPLYRLYFLTRPSGTNWDGICQTDSIEVEFEPAGPAAGADTRVRPRRFVSTTFFFVPDPAGLRSPSRAEEPDDPASAQARWEARAEAACAHVDPRNVQLINASPEYQLTALRLLLDLTDDARAGRLAIPLDCSGIGPRDASMSDAQCRASFAQLRLGTVDLITGCDPPMPVVCHRLSTGSYQVDLIMAPNNQRVASAKIEAMVVGADQLID